MDLVLWRHAEAEEWHPGCDDVARKLTPRGEKQAFRMARWLDRQLPDSVRILVSPTRRTEQTALSLGRKYKLCDELLPSENGCAALLKSVNWPLARGAVLVVGHQPTLGQVIAELLALKESECTVRKGATWWLRSRQREGQWQTLVVTVQSPEIL